MKLTLDNDLMIDDFFENIRCLGVVCPLRNYQFLWTINHTLGFNFRAATIDTLHMKKNDRTYHFNLYHFSGTENREHAIYQNQYDGGFLLPEWKHIDYIWTIKSDFNIEIYLNDLIGSLKTIAQIMLVTELSLEKIKNPAHLII